MLLAVTDGAEDLVPAPRDAQAGLARIRLGHSHVYGRRRAFARPPRGGVEQAARGVDVSHEIGARVLDRLVSADRPSTLHPRLRVLDGELDHALGGADHLAGARERTGPEPAGAAHLRPAPVLAGHPDRVALELEHALRT